MPCLYWLLPGDNVLWISSKRNHWRQIGLSFLLQCRESPTVVTMSEIGVFFSIAIEYTITVYKRKITSLYISYYKELYQILQNFQRSVATCVTDSLAHSWDMHTTLLGCARAWKVRLGGAHSSSRTHARNALSLELRFWACVRLGCAQLGGTCSQMRAAGHTPWVHSLESALLALLQQVIVPFFFLMPITVRTDSVHFLGSVFLGARLGCTLH